MKSTRVVGVLLLASLIANVLLFMWAQRAGERDYEAKYGELRVRYITLAESQKALLEAAQKDVGVLKAAFSDAYSDLSSDDFQELVRRKIVKLDLEVKALRGEKAE